MYLSRVHAMREATKRALLIALIIFSLASVFSQSREQAIRENIPLDSIRLSDPFILADKNTSMYYMTGTGGKLWKSKDLKKWTGPFNVVKIDSSSWMGKKPMIWAAELHYYKGKYYYFATFTNKDVKIDKGSVSVIARRVFYVVAIQTIVRQ